MSSGSGDFDLPKVYEQNLEFVMEELKKGDIDYAGMSKWRFADEFLCFALKSGFFEFIDQSYPNPRKKNEVPVWFLMSCQIILRIFQSNHYEQLIHFLNAGSILTRVGFNVSNPAIGFNDKNRYARKMAVHHDTVRKFFKDTNPLEIRNWYNESLQGWFRWKRTFDSDGLFVLDQTHLVVPDNPNYKGAVKMPVDEHGQWYPCYSDLTGEQKEALIHHPCYALSLLLHINHAADLFHIAGYEFGPGNEDELTQAKRFLPDFCRVYRGTIKELIMDRGYVDGKFLGSLKKDYNVDVLIPMKRYMSSYKDAVEIAHRLNQWETTEEQKDSSGKIIKETKTAFVQEVDLWESCPVKMNTYVSNTKRWSERKQGYETYTWVLGATKKYKSLRTAISRYGLRTKVEERNRQLKLGWQIRKFPSPAEGLIESHISFTLLTYSLFQLYLRRKDLKTQTNRTIMKLQHEEQASQDSVTIYAKNVYGVVNFKKYTQVILNMNESAKMKINQMVETIQGDMQRIV